MNTGYCIHKNRDCKDKTVRRPRHESQAKISYAIEKICILPRRLLDNGIWAASAHSCRRKADSGSDGSVADGFGGKSTWRMFEQYLDQVEARAACRLYLQQFLRVKETQRESQHSR